MDLWATVTRMMAVPALGSGSDRSPGSPCCSCCSGGCWRWEAEEVVHCEAACRSWSRLGFPREYEWVFAEEATVVWVASALSKAAISARSSVWGKAQSLISSPCSFSSACGRAKEAPGTDSPLASPVWASESPIGDPCWSVISDLPQTISAGWGLRGLFKTGGAWVGDGVVCSQGCKGTRKNQGGEPNERKRKQATHNITRARRRGTRRGVRMEGQDWVAGILWDTHDGREAQSRLTEPESDGAGDMGRVAEREKGRTRKSGRAPLTDQIRRHAPGCRL